MNAETLAKENSRLKDENERLREALQYWLPKDEPLHFQTDVPSIAHRAKWHEVRSLLKG